MKRVNRHFGKGLGLACLIAAALPPAAHAATLAEGAWVVVERCGENNLTKDPKLKAGYDRQIQLSVAKGRISGHDRDVRKRDGAVTTTAYDGAIDGAKITITGTGVRSDNKQPWTYAYEGSVTADGHAELIGAIYQRAGEAAQPVKLRACSMTFVAPKDAAEGPPAQPSQK
jgi:hypothetical protein